MAHNRSYVLILDLRLTLPFKMLFLQIVTKGIGIYQQHCQLKNSVIATKARAILSSVDRQHVYVLSIH